MDHSETLSETTEEEFDFQIYKCTVILGRTKAYERPRPHFAVAFCKVGNTSNKASI